jgi:hypothetical protein
VAGTAYSCKRRQGALLILPHDGTQEDVIRTKVFEDYIRDNVDNWFSFAHRRGMGVERMEDLILVSGCTLVTSWGAAVFADSVADGELSLGFQASHGGGATFHWNNIGPGVTYWNSHQGPVRPLCRSPLPPTNFSFTVLKRAPYARINVYSSKVFEQSVSFYGHG